MTDTLGTAEIKSRKRGRPTLLTDEITQRAAAAIRGGGSWDDASAATGIPVLRLLEWQRRGRGEDRDRPAEPGFENFAKAVEKARSALRLECLGVIRNAAPKSWQAAAWLLERKWPAEFALVNRLRDETRTENRPSLRDIDADRVRQTLAELDELGRKRRKAARPSVRTSQPGSDAP